ncbi:hypothetical protein [Methylobacterium sp. A54F]
MNSSEGDFVPPAATPEPTAEPSARFGQTGPGTLIQNVHVRTDEVNIHQPSMAALEKMAVHSPEIANQLIEGTKFVVKQDTKKFITGAIIAGLVACTIIICSTVTIVNAGFWAGIALFMAAVVVFGIMIAALTGKAQDISWVVKVIPGIRNKKDD